jgi:hypothetical protein
MARILILLFMHSVADFVLQGERLSKLKATKIVSLFLHVGVYTALFIIVSPLVLGLTFMQGLVFSLVNGGAHLLVDLTTSKLKLRFWDKNESRYFAVISFDHFAHVAILIATYLFMFPEALNKIF